MVEHQRRQVVEAVVGRELGAVGVGQPGRQGLGAHLARVGPRGVQDGAAGPVDRPRVDPVERAQVAAAVGQLGLDVGQALPAAADAEHLVARPRWPDTRRS